MQFQSLASLRLTFGQFYKLDNAQSIQVDMSPHLQGSKIGMSLNYGSTSFSFATYRPLTSVDTQAVPVNGILHGRNFRVLQNKLMHIGGSIPSTAQAPWSQIRTNNDNSFEFMIVIQRKTNWPRCKQFLTRCVVESASLPKIAFPPLGIVATRPVSLDKNTSLSEILQPQLCLSQLFLIQCLICTQQTTNR